MKNKTSYAIPPAERRVTFPRALAAVVMAVATIVSFPGCSPKTDINAQTSSVTASNVTLTAAQRQNIHLYTVKQSKFHKTIETTGTVDFDNDQATSVLAPFSGPVSRLLVSLGAQVSEGDSLAVVDSPDFATAISTYRKALATAKTARRLAELDHDLIQHQGVSRREAEQAETDATNAEADRDAALQALVSLKVDPQTIKDIQEGRTISHIESMIRSPIAGTVVEKLITPGQLLQAGSTPCFTVADLSQVWVMANIFESDVAAIDLGDSAEVFTSAAPTSFPGKVDNLAAILDPNTRSIGVRVVAKNPGGVLKKQMYVRVRIRSNRESTGLLVPVSAILRDDENLPFVYVASADGAFERRQVTLGYRVGDDYEDPSGLKAGEQIVAEGAVFIQFLQNQ